MYTVSRVFVLQEPDMLDCTWWKGLQESIKLGTCIVLGEEAEARTSSVQLWVTLL